jgi:tetratricopeptide (TPR) repeat protein
LNNGNFQKAFEYSEIILMIKPESQQAILLLVDPFLETRNWEELTEILDQIIFSSPNNSLAHAVRGWSELQKNEGSRELAISEMEQASKLEQEESETIRYILKSKIILNFTDDDLLLTAHMGFKLLQNDFEFNSVIAKIMLDKNNLDEAITYLDTIQKYSPNHPNTYALFADYYRKIGDYKKSMDYYSKALNLQPEWNVAWFYEGYSDTLFKLDFISQAIENFCKAKKIESEKIKNFNNFDFSCE